MLLSNPVTLTLMYTDGRSSVFPFSLSAQSQSDSDRMTAWRAEMADGEQVVRLEPREAVCLKRACIRLPLELSADALAFHNSLTTNGWAEVRPFAELVRESVTSKEMVCIRSGGEELHIAFTSVDKLMTVFRFEENALCLYFLLEDKPLPSDGLRLERFWVEQTLSAQDFLDAYAARMAERYHVRLPERIPSGWCSWGIAYSNLREEDVAHVVDDLTERYGDKELNLVQLDDGWEKDGIFSGLWSNSEGFPSGIPAICKKVNDSGMDFGLWMSPTFIHVNSPVALECPERMHRNPDGSIYESRAIPGSGSLELDSPEGIQYIRDIFRQTNSYGSVYYKLDFLIFSQVSSWTGDMLDNFYVYKTGYQAEVYRKLMQVIREEVGSRYLLCCGATTAENIGIFDGARTTPDITRTGVNPEGSFFLAWKCAANCLYRAFYHKRLFINDPDGVIVREYWNNDTYDMNEHEARFWATACAFSGGSLLLNEFPWKTADSRMKLFEEIVPVLGIAARPLDFYEQPMPSVAVIDCGVKKLVAVYNISDDACDKVLPLSALGFDGACAVVDAWEKKLLGAFEGEMKIPQMWPHSANVYLVQKKPEGRAPLGTTDNLYMGVADAELKGDCIWWE